MKNFNCRTHIGLILIFRPFKTEVTQYVKSWLTTVTDFKHARFSLSRLRCTQKRLIFIDI